MYNTDMPTRADLPSSTQLLRSTAIAIAAAGAILVTVVLPAEYAIDPTGAGRALGLTEMGEIKAQLADEAARDKERDQSAPAPERRSSLSGALTGLLISSANAQTASTPATISQKTEEATYTLKPGEFIEAKLGMKKGAKVKFRWSVMNGAVNYDMHGEARQISKSYAKGRGSAGEEGVLEAAFDGSHGWFWRNRGKAPVKVTLRVDGPYGVITATPGN